MAKVKLIKRIVRAILFITLLAIFYFMYMKNAIKQFQRKPITLAEERRKKPKLEPPVLVICPDPPLKPSFFES